MHKICLLFKYIGWVGREVDNFSQGQEVLIGLSEASMADRNQRSSKASLPASDDNQTLVLTNLKG